MCLQSSAAILRLTQLQAHQPVSIRQADTAAGTPASQYQAGSIRQADTAAGTAAGTTVIQYQAGTLIVTQTEPTSPDTTPPSQEWIQLERERQREAEREAALLLEAQHRAAEEQRVLQRRVLEERAQLDELRAAQLRAGQQRILDEKRKRLAEEMQQVSCGRLHPARWWCCRGASPSTVVLLQATPQPLSGGVSLLLRTPAGTHIETHARTHARTRARTHTSAHARTRAHHHPLSPNPGSLPGAQPS